jgi:prevent-host-death family protein
MTLPLAGIKARLSEIVDRVQRHHEPVVLTPVTADRQR